MKVLITLLIVIGAIGNSYADCNYGGTDYPTGSVVNGYICNEDGTWENG